MATTPLILFDIDGTLLRGNGVGRVTLERAFHDVLERSASGNGVDLSSVPFHGNTDFAIVGEGLRALGLAPEPALVAAILERYLLHLAAAIARANPFFALPGAVNLVERLAARKIPLGLGTGNVEPAARMKVTAIGLGERFAFGGYGCDHIDRGELLRVGWQRGAAHVARPPERCRVLVIGDTLRDIAAARHIGAAVLAVATGGDPIDRLSASAPDHLVESLQDPSVDTFLEAWLEAGLEA